MRSLRSALETTDTRRAVWIGAGRCPPPIFDSLTVDATAFTGGSYTGNLCWSVYDDDPASLEMYTDTGRTTNKRPGSRFAS